ncbi:M48 family metallopeptidase [Psychrobacter sp. T6-1]|uniref:M48 family metallopeptidase n=1 Tax=Psychrobacter sp. T6-1 TaxID=3457447 RepID=UPI003FD2AFC3
MKKNHSSPKHRTPLLENALNQLAAAGIALDITQKRVKNINFRLKPYQLKVSIPLFVGYEQAAQAIDKRVPWAIDNHAQILAQHQRKQAFSANDMDNSPVLLWGEPQALVLTDDEKIALYRQQLTEVTPALLDKWQPIVGANAKEVRFKKMHTRWGICNTRVRRVWLSVYLPAYAIECTEYVIVHELCHLHHANHSEAFWQTVREAMPEYKRWHDMLAGKSGRLD